MRRSSVLAVLLLAMLLPEFGSAQTRVRVAAPPTPAPEVIATAIECNAHIAYVPKRQRCLSCVASGHRFFRQGDGGAGYCDAPPPPAVPAPPPASVEYLRTPGQCATLVINPQKRARCFECIRRGGTFNRQGEYGFGLCYVAAAPPPPPVVEVLRTIGECTSYIGLPAKRARCYDCVNRRGTFYREGEGGFGHCMYAAPPPPPPPAAPELLTVVSHCYSYIPESPKRHRCMDCIGRGGTFIRQGDMGFGQCRFAAPAPPPPPPPPPPPANYELTSIEQCYQIAHPGTRNHCRKCLRRGGRWDMRGMCHF